MPPSIWPWTACGIERAADVLRRADPDHPGQPRSTSTSATTRMAEHANATCARSPPTTWPGLRVERMRAGVAVDALDADLVAGLEHAASARELLLTSRQASWTAPAVIHVCREAEDEPADWTASVVCGATTTFSTSSSVRATWAMTSTTPWPTSAAAEYTSATSSPAASANSRTRAAVEVVEALRVADVLEADREADAAADALPARRVAGAAGEADRVARQLLRLRDGDVGAAADHLGDRKRAGDHLAGREHVARTRARSQAQLDAADPERVRELVHLRLVREAGLDGAEAAHGAAGRVVRVDARRLELRVRHRCTARTRTTPRSTSRRSELDA